MTPLLLALAKKKEVDVSAHIEVATSYLWIALALLILFFILRPELWRRLWFQRIDPRGPALARMALGATLVWTFVDLLVLQGEWLFTDQGMLLTEMARKNYGGKMRTLWDPEHGFEHWYDALVILTDRWSVLFIRSDPPFVYTMFGLLFLFGSMMTLGLFTRISTIMSWLLMLQLYNYNPIYYTGGDTVMRVMMFLGMFIDWGQAYSLDAWRRRRRAIRGGATHVPAYEMIPAWPVRLLMIQLACIYCATGLLKSGKTWANGTALYYALNLDHFYRIPAFRLYAWADKLYVTRVMTVVVHWWEALFPLVFVGEALRGLDKDQSERKWVGPVPRWTFYALGLLGSVYAVWHQDTWVRVLPLFVLAVMVYVDRRLPEPDRAGKSALAWEIRVLSWACLAGFVLIGAVFADLAILYYYTPPKNAPPLAQNKDLLRTLASIATIVIPLLLTGIILILRAWAPRAYRFTRDWLLGKRLWLTMGFLMHVGIDLTMNVGTFVQVMIAVYPAWLGGADVDAMWRFVLWRQAKRGEAGRPEVGPWRRYLNWLGYLMGLLETNSAVEILKTVLKAPLLLVLGLVSMIPLLLGVALVGALERAKYRVRPTPWAVLHPPDEASVRRVALLRCWDLGERLDFELDSQRKGSTLVLRAPDGSTIYEGASAGRQLISLFPGLWWLWPICVAPVWILVVPKLARRVVAWFDRVGFGGRLVLLILRQR